MMVCFLPGSPHFCMLHKMQLLLCKWAWSICINIQIVRSQEEKTHTPAGGVCQGLISCHTDMLVFWDLWLCAQNDDEHGCLVLIFPPPPSATSHLWSLSSVGEQASSTVSRILAASAFELQVTTLGRDISEDEFSLDWWQCCILPGCTESPWSFPASLLLDRLTSQSCPRATWAEACLLTAARSLRIQSRLLERKCLKKQTNKQKTARGIHNHPTLTSFHVLLHVYVTCWRDVSF